MLRRKIGIFIVSFVVSLSTAVGWAQSRSRVKYDPSAETRISGTVEDIREFQCPVSGGLGYHLVLRAGDQPTTVHVAASSFMRDYEITFAKGDQVEVLGARVKLENGEEAVLAREIKRGQNTYAFRDKDGKPLW